MVMCVLDPSRSCGQQACSSIIYTSTLASLISAPVASTGAQDSCFLGPQPHLSSFELQPVHLLLPPLGSRGVEASKKMVIRRRERVRR